MAQGLQVFDENGVTIYDSDSRLARVVGTVTASLGSPKTGYVDIPLQYFENNTVFFVLTETAAAANSMAIALSLLTISVNGRRINYTNLPCDLIYGVY